MSRLKHFISNGWPVNCKSLDESVKPFFKHRHELHVIDDLVFKNVSLVVPVVLQNEMLNILHESHQGVDRTLSLARDKLFWPNLSHDVFLKIKSCCVCQKYKRSNPREPLQPHDPVHLPWTKLGIDFFDCNKHKYLMIVDYFSQYFEICHLTSTGHQAVITNLKSTFARHGIPLQVFSDNGPPFNGIHFKNFCQEWGIAHVTSSPHYPRSNGLVERTIGTVKKLLLKCHDDQKDPYIALLNLRTTPKGTLSSPSMLLMSRQLRTKIPECSNNLKPKLVDYKKESCTKKNKVDVMCKYYNRGTHPLKPLSEHEPVMFKKLPTSPWTPGKVVDVSSEPRSYIVSTPDGSEFRRNRQHIASPSQVSSPPHNSPQTSRFGRKVQPPRRFTFSE